MKFDWHTRRKMAAFQSSYLGHFFFEENSEPFFNFLRVSLHFNDFLLANMVSVLGLIAM